MTNSSVPIYQPDLSGNERRYVNECLDSTWISSKGAFIQKFEEAFSDFSGLAHTVSVTNGTVALHVALLALGIKTGDEVIVPTLTYISPVNAITYTGAKPVFVDSLSKSWQMDPKDIKRKITSKTRAIMVVHLYGQPCDMDPIMSIAKKHNLRVIEDCAEAIGSTYKGKHVGTFGDIACFSFFGNKTITAGEGGMVASQAPSLIKMATRIKGQGLAEGREYWHDIIGYNYRLTNISAAIGLAQLERAQDFIKRKRMIAKLYQEQLDKGILFHKAVGNVVHSYWMCSIQVSKASQREPLRKYLANRGVETRPVFFPVHTMPMYVTNQSFKIAEDIGARGINLPSWPGLKDEEVIFVAHQINEFIKG